MQTATTATTRFSRYKPCHRVIPRIHYPRPSSNSRCPNLGKSVATTSLESDADLTTHIIESNRWQELHGATVMPRLNGHCLPWLQAVSRGLKHPIILIAHRNSDDEIDGLLPLMRVESFLFGKFLTSLPYLNTGGVWCASSIAAKELIDHACQLTDELDARYLELRHELPFSHPRLNAERNDKVHMRLQLPETDEEFEKSMKSKLRSQVKKAGQHEMEVCFGQAELLDDFYRVFAINMRDLGTPVYSIQLFAQILEAFRGDAELCIVRLKGQPVAGAILVHASGLSEVPSASALRSFNHLSPNMLMYRHLLRRSIERGNRVFDFGRSSHGSGTYRFKEQWGAQPHPSAWQYYLRRGSVEDMTTSSPRKQRLIELWK